MTSKTRQNRPKQATPRQRELAALLLTVDLQTAAAALGIHRHTATRWRNLPAVRAELSRLTDTATADAAARVAGMLTGAADVLSTIMHDQAQPAGARVAAAGRLLETGPKIKDTSDLADRVTALEEGTA